MATPPRLTEIACPNCLRTTWIISSDSGGLGSVSVPYPERTYACRGCERSGPGWRVKRQSPPEFLMQPHDLYPMRPKAFAFWADVLKAEFPDHPRVAELGTTFRPRTRADVKARQQAFRRAHPVVEMRDQDGACVEYPEARQASEWLEVLRPGDFIVLESRDGAELRVAGAASGPLTVRRTAPDGSVVAHITDCDPERAQAEVLTFLEVGSGSAGTGRRSTRQIIRRAYRKLRGWLAR